jgi:hypothetical protein
LLVAGCWLLVAGCWLLVAGCWLLVAGCWLLVAGCWLLVHFTENLLFVKPYVKNSIVLCLFHFLALSSTYFDQIQQKWHIPFFCTNRWFANQHKD